MAGRRVFGFTGAFGSGCTTSAKHLHYNKGYEYISLSKVVKDRWAAANPGRNSARFDLQRTGDDIRKAEGSHALVTAALQDQDHNHDAPLVIDGLRNVGEIEHLRDLFGYYFTLVALLSSKDDRWARIGQRLYLDNNLTKTDFDDDDERDWEEDTPYGQQVRLCVDKADILIDNSEELGRLGPKVIEYAELVTGEKPRHANETEIFMNMAFSSSHSSKCLKRHVGAIIVDSRGQVVGVGFNENPLGTKPCAEEENYSKKCYRDLLRNDHFKDLSKRGARCPRCGDPLPLIEGPPWKCPTCIGRSDKANLEPFFFPDRAMSWCTAIHAEVWAILAAAERARGGTLYTTTFPCFQCAEKIIQVGVKTIYFTEVYPDPHSGKRLELADMTLYQFEGVRSLAFERIFSAMQPN
jgi:deoxycytidylate deaminase/dephospho-CoA kinase